MPPFSFLILSTWILFLSLFVNLHESWSILLIFPTLCFIDHFNSFCLFVFINFSYVFDCFLHFFILGVISFCCCSGVFRCFCQFISIKYYEFFGLSYSTLRWYYITFFTCTKYAMCYCSCVYLSVIGYILFVFKIPCKIWQYRINCIYP